MTYKQSVSDFAQKLDRVPKEIRAMSGVPSAVQKPQGSQSPKPAVPVQTAPKEPG